MMKAHSSGVSDYCLSAMMKFIILTEEYRGCVSCRSVGEKAGGWWRGIETTTIAINSFPSALWMS